MQGNRFFWIGVHMTLLIIYLSIAIGISFLCSVLEAVLLSITPSYVEKLVQEKPRSGALITRIKSDRLDESLASILILNTFAHTMGAAGVGAQAVNVFGAKWETLVAVLLTLAILYFSEIIPKTLGATFWQSLVSPTAHIINVLVKLVYPLVWISTRITKIFRENKENDITHEEIIALASLGHKGGSLHTQENDYLANLFKLREIRVEKVLTPRSVVHSLPETMTVSEALDQEQTRQFSRIPVYEKDIDHITGKVFRRDLYEAERSGQGSDIIKNYSVPLLRVSEKLPVQQLLDFLIKHKVHLCLVEDEFGQTSGIVTLEDAIETLLGREIVDESDPVEDMQQYAKEKYRDRLRAEKYNQD